MRLIGTKEFTTSVVNVDLESATHTDSGDHGN